MTNSYKQWLKNKGYCINCCKEKAFEGRTMCPDCLDKNKERAERTRSEKSKEQRRKYIKRKRELCIAFGVCRECFKRTAKVGLKCTECYAKEINRRERNRKTVKRNMRTELGLCYFCGKQSVKGYKTCKIHLKLQGDKLKKWHSNNRDNSNHYWRRVQSAEIEKIRQYFL